MSSIETKRKPKILVFLGRYLPGFSSGGPVRTISCIVEALAGDFEFFIVTLNRDSDGSEVYKTVRTGEWNAVGRAQVFYTPRFTMAGMSRIAREVAPDAIYFNGFFSTSSILGLLKRRMGGFDRVRLVLAPRGDLAGGALALKSAKKRLYLTLAKTLGLYRDLLWHASSEREKHEMLRQLSALGVTEEQIHVAPDLGFGYEDAGVSRPKKVAREAKFVTVGRIVRMKNLGFTLDRLAELSGTVSLDIFGPVQDRELWSECEAKIAKLPANVTVRCHGPLDPAGVIGELATRHFFILPTLGENYGHVIIEGAAAGCPVVISDRTQWLDLASKQVGWDIPLNEIGQWRSVLQGCVEMDEVQYEAMSKRAADFGRSIMNSAENLTANIELFRRAVNVNSGSSQQAVAAGAKK